MSGRKTQNVIVGAVVLVALFLLIFGMAFLSEYRPGQRNEEYVIKAGQVGLLSEGDPVKFNGVKVGKVTRIELTKDHLVEIGAEVQAGVRIPVGSTVEIQNVGLMGERMINVVLSNNTSSYPPGTVLTAKYDYGIAETMGAAGEVMEQVKVMVDQLQAVLDSTVGRKDFVPRVNAIVDRADKVSARLDELVAQLTPQVKGAVTDLASAGKSARGIADRATPVVDRLMDRADKSTAELEPLLADLKSTSSDIRAIAGKARNGESTLGKLANDTLFYGQLSNAVNRADSLIHRIQRKGLDINVDLW
jgi:phospholipid/cholesterol/gamma-HCH transport system substrate-binding protein